MRYIGLIEGPLKTRYTNHKSDMTSKKLKGGTTLSSTLLRSGSETSHIKSTGR